MNDAYLFTCSYSISINNCMSNTIKTEYFVTNKTLKETNKFKYNIKMNLCSRFNWQRHMKKNNRIIKENRITASINMV